jgi:hypothetical protein
VKLILPCPKPRNRLVPACLHRRAGAHRSTGGGRRQADRQALRKEVEALRPSP